MEDQTVTLVHSNRMKTADVKSSRELQRLLWHINLTNRLSTADSDFLAQFSPNGCQFFIRKNGEVIYPENPAIASFEEIEIDLDNTISAFFTHNYQTADGQYFKILTYTFDPNDAGTLNLGLVVPADLLFSSTVEDSFINAVEQFQTIYHSIVGELPQVESALINSKPALVILRDTGEIIGSNEKITSLLNRTETDIIDTNYFELQPQLTELFPDLAIQLANINHAESELSVISFSIKEKNIKKTTLASMVITEQLTNHLSHVTLAYSDMMDHFKDENKEENKSLIESSLKEMDKINRYIQLYNLINSFEEITKEPQSVLLQLEYALESTTSTFNLMNSDTIDSIELNAPHLALKTFFETIITSIDVTGSNTKINCLPSENIEIHFTAPLPDEINRKKQLEFLPLLSALADKLGFKLTELVNQNNQTTSVVVTGKTQDKS